MVSPRIKKMWLSRVYQRHWHVYNWFIYEIGLNRSTIFVLNIALHFKPQPQRQLQYCGIYSYSSLIGALAASKVFELGYGGLQGQRRELLALSSYDYSYLPREKRSQSANNASCRYILKTVEGGWAYAWAEPMTTRSGQLNRLVIIEISDTLSVTSVSRHVTIEFSVRGLF